MSSTPLSSEAIVLFENGIYYKGKAAGATGTTTGEICFNTGMTGYQETFTDPSYFGQILLSTNVHVGNYGIKNNENESDKVQISGLICRDFNIEYSRSQADQDIQAYFEENNLVCIHDVDTRAIVRMIRDKGAMNCIISTEHTDVELLSKKLKETPSMEGLELASLVSTNSSYEKGDITSPLRVAILDFGIKRNIVECFVQRGCYVKVFPAKTPFEKLLDFEPTGFFLSNGPGDPASMDYAIELTKSILSTKKPIFGICLGHQILALAAGLKTYKMHHGHRGANHPVINIATGKCEITSQNHGFAVCAESLSNSKDIELTHTNLNDNSVEGIKLKGSNAFSVQYHPESNPGPHDSRYLFDNFVTILKQTKNN